jgi:hypothetical protein
MGHQNAIGGKSPLQAKAHIFPLFVCNDYGFFFFS